MTSETIQTSIDMAEQCGREAFEREDYDPEPMADEKFVEVVEEYGNVNLLIRAYNRGFDDAMMASTE